MPRYTVLWHTEATNDLAELWIEAIDRRPITNAADTIDRVLHNDPTSKGHELSEGLRVFVEPPLQVLFVVRDDDRVVEVLRLKLI